ncbi:MAG TPA: hemophore, partial [Mycobacterium sp.]|nr:hemophore [Mycobacterium sp.]
MRTTNWALRRCLCAMFAATAVGGASMAALMGSTVPSATAATDPCAASELARTIGSVATSMGTYLDS